MIDQHKTLTEKFIKKGFWLYLFSFIIAPMGYIIKIIISGELTVSEVGILYGIIGLLSFIGVLNDFGLTESLNHFIPKYVNDNKYDKVKSILIYTLIIQIITGFTITLLFFLGADLIANNYFKNSEAINSIKILAFFFFGINIFQIISTFFMSIQNTLYLKITDLSRMGFTLISILIIFFLDIGSLELFSASWIIGLYIGIFVSIFLFYKKYYKLYFKSKKILWDITLFKKILKYAIIVLIGSQAGSILGQMDMQMIIFLLGTQDAGYYTVYLSIIGIPFLIIGPIFGFLFPMISEMHAKGDIKSIRSIKSIFQSKFLIIGISFNILLFIFSDIITFILFGKSFITSGVILKYSILFLVFNYLLQINFNIMAGVGKVNDRMKIIFIAIIFNFILNLILINYMLVYGAALATGLGWLLIWILSQIYLEKKYIVGFNYKFLTKNIIFIGLLGIFSYYLIVPIFEGINRINSLLYLFIIGILWFTMLLGFNYKEFKGFILEVRNLRK